MTVQYESIKSNAKALDLMLNIIHDELKNYDKGEDQNYDTKAA